MSLNRRQLLFAAPAALTGRLAARARYPERPVTLVDPFTAGSSTDYFSRVLATEMGKLWGQPVVVENKAGGGGSVGAETVVRAAPDGYVLGMASVSTLVSNPVLNRMQHYDPLADFTLISTLVTVPSATVVLASSPLKTLDDLVKAARARPGGVSFASPGVGSAGHVLLEHFSHLAGAKFNHVPYRGGGPLQTELLGGQIDAASENLPLLMPHIQSGRLRVLAVRDLQRLSQLPEAPTFKELGYEPVSQPLWFGLVGPAGLPRDVVQRLCDATHQAVRAPGFRQQAERVAATVSSGTPEQFRAQVGRWLDQYEVMVRTTRMRPERAERANDSIHASGTG
ncbi:tripartite tricarboxylate transporter substrate binding protein [Schlegelella sp. S2-27]|uniref:Tripartite tricarboxylate transporter substrate binding protein n=1 Tax=Caldimonas mangrovi TaxID=2944811 RepID=A0ABT0YVY1_9BURK|nr:tripartite tricarboxylate transporter substrate binding protein [Caldimonas mangrovi]MCM5682897.1 tripartite tricarboxylate transporter substrate binding protein [Caldimonas mangrovi]